MNLSLTSGLIPVTWQVLAVIVLVLTVGRGRPGAWLWRWLLASTLVGAGFSAAVTLFVRDQGWSAQPISAGTVFWTGMLGFAVTILVGCWRHGTWLRRGAAVLSVVLVALCCLAALNTATGYLPTVKTAWQRVTDTRPEQWIDESQLAAMQQHGDRPTRGTVVRVTTPDDASGFAHRTEIVYLPPAWFSTNPPPQLPALMMIGGEFNHPDDWLQSTVALQALDDFAALHHGNAPVVVFPDIAGRFQNDTECVDGPRGNAAAHLTKDVVPYLLSRFGVSPDPRHWGITGWSAGGTCALLTAVRNPNLFSAFMWLEGTLGPNAGTKRQTVARLFGGDENAWAAFDPREVIRKHGPYRDMTAWLGVSGETPTIHRAAGDAPPESDALGAWDTFSEDRIPNADKLCTLLSGYQVECSVVGYPGGHDFQSAGRAFQDALPWLAGELGTPDAQLRSLPGANPR